MKIQKLNDLIVAVAPITGISIGLWNDKNTWRIHFSPEATDEQRQAANNIVLNFDISDDPVELRAERYKAEADPFLIQAMGYTFELEREQNEAKRTTITNKRNAALDAYIAVKTRIRQEIL